MLNWTDVIFYIRESLSLPSTFFEMTDDQVKRWVLLTAHKDFSKWIPSIAHTGVDPLDTRYQAGEANHFLFFDDEDLPILGVRNYFWNDTADVASGHPVVNPMSFQEMTGWALSVFKSNMVKPFTYWGFTAKYFRPNKIRVLPKIELPFVVEYEREHPSDLREIPAEFSRMYMDLALAEIKIKIGSVRSAYGDGTISTPFGEIPLRGDTFKQEGMELKDKIIEELKDYSLPGVFVDTY